MRIKNAIIFHNVDREDYWVTGGLSFLVENTHTYKESYEEIKELIETPEVINYVVSEMCLLDDLFDGDETFQFIETQWDRRLEFHFKNSEGETRIHEMNADYLFIANGKNTQEKREHMKVGKAKLGRKLTIEFSVIESGILTGDYLKLHYGGKNYDFKVTEVVIDGPLIDVVAEETGYFADYLSRNITNAVDIIGSELTLVIDSEEKSKINERSSWC